MRRREFLRGTLSFLGGLLLLVVGANLLSFVVYSLFYYEEREGENFVPLAAVGCPILLLFGARCIRSGVDAMAPSGRLTFWLTWVFLNSLTWLGVFVPARLFTGLYWDHWWFGMPRAGTLAHLESSWLQAETLYRFAFMDLRGAASIAMGLTQVMLLRQRWSRIEPAWWLLATVPPMVAAVEIGARVDHPLVVLFGSCLVPSVLQALILARRGVGSALIWIVAGSLSLLILEVGLDTLAMAGHTLNRDLEYWLIGITGILVASGTQGLAALWIVRSRLKDSDPPTSAPA